MGVDCSMIIRCDFHDDGNHAKKVKYMYDFIGLLKQKCKVPFTSPSLEDVYEDACRFEFKAFDSFYFNLYDGFWECESIWRYWQYLNGDIRRLFFDVAQHFEAQDIYICAESYGWNGGINDTDDYASWLKRITKRHGDIPEFDPAVTPSIPWESQHCIYHDSFEDLHAEKKRIAAIAKSYGMEETGIDNYYNRFYVFVKDGNYYLYDDLNSKLFLEKPISDCEIMEFGTFDVIVDGTKKRYSSDGEMIQIK